MDPLILGEGTVSQNLCEVGFFFFFLGGGLGMYPMYTFRKPLHIGLLQQLAREIKAQLDNKRAKYGSLVSNSSE